jgi:PAS domain S-box-containing protein
METGFWLGLLQNAALLLSLVVLYDLLTLQALRRKPALEQLLAGGALALVVLAVMSVPVPVHPGIFFDTRSVLLALAGLFFGPMPTAIAALAATAFRVALGGPGTAMGVAVIAESALVGLTWRHWRRGDPTALSFRELYALGVVVHGILLACTVLLPSGIRGTVLRSIALPVLLVYPLATMAVGLLLRRRLERMEALQALEESEEKLKQIVEHSTNLFYSHTPDHVLTYVSPQSRYFLGCSPEEARTRWTRFVTDNPVNARSYEATERAIRTGLAQPPYELELRTKDGRILWVEVHEAPVVKNGRTVAVVGALADITERKLAEEGKRRAEAQLQWAQKMEAVGRLASGVVHDFNNMLNILRIHTEVARRRAGDPEVVQRSLEEIRQVTDRAAGLVRQLLGFARKQEVSPQRLSLNEVLAPLVSLLRPAMGREVQVLFEPGPLKSPVWMDPGQLDQVVTNLAMNARDALEGAGTITVRTVPFVPDEEFIRQNPYVRPGEYVLLEVQDTGKGIPAEVLPKVFEPFFTTKGDQGTGLGLATVYGIVKQNGGFVHLESQEGQGTVVRILLPVRQGERDPEGTALQPSPR